MAVGRNVATVLGLLLVAPGDHLLVAGAAGNGGCSGEVPNGDRWRLRRGRPQSQIKFSLNSSKHGRLTN